MDGKVIIETELSTKSFEEQIKQTEQYLNRLVDSYNKAGDAKGKFKPNEEAMANLRQEIEKTNNSLITLREKQNAIGKTDLSNINKQINSIGGSISNVIKKVAKWSLAVIGIRSVYLGIRSIMNQLTQYDESLKTNVDYMKWAIANAMKPVIEWIVNALYTILKVIAQIIYTFTGFNIFEKSGIKDYNKAMVSANKGAKELKKTLAGFDEMNILGDNTQMSGGGGGGVTGPDLSKAINDENVLAKLGEKIANGWVDIGNSMKEALDNPQVFQDAYGYWGTFVEGVVRIFYGIWEAITGIVEVVGGVMDVVVGIFTGNFELIKEGFKSIADGFIRIISGILDAFVGVLQVGFGFLKGILGEIWSGIKWLGTTIWNFIYQNVILPISNGVQWLWNGIKNIISSIVQFLKNAFQSVVTFFSNIINKILGLFKTLGTKVGNVIGGAFKAVINAILKAIETILNSPIRAINKLIDVINKVPGVSIGNLSEIHLPRLARGGIVNNPGPGVMMGSYIAGENGPEAVIPLDDNTLDRLGLAFAKHTVINATLVNQMNGRLISRELQKIQNESEFAYNK